MERVDPYSQDTASVKTQLTIVMKIFRIFYEYFLARTMVLEN